MWDLDQPGKNPFEPPKLAKPSASQAVDGDARATPLRQSFLRRVIAIHSPIDVILDYSAWNFRQRILINEKVVWFRWTWVWFHKIARFDIPNIEKEGQPCRGRVELQIGRNAKFESFRVYIDNDLCYEETNGFVA